MKSHTDIKSKESVADTDDAIRKPSRLDPIRKSGKERHSLYDELDEEEGELDYRGKRESVLDYFDDGEDDL